MKALNGRSILMYAIVYCSLFVFLQQKRTGDTWAAFVARPARRITPHIPIRNGSVSTVLPNMRSIKSDYGIPMTRSERFPSVQDRVKLYMSNWYLPPCSDNSRIRYKYDTENPRFLLVKTRNKGYGLDSSIVTNTLFYLDRNTSIIETCNKTYCDDVRETLFSSMSRLGYWNDDSFGELAIPVPVLIQFGDFHYSSLLQGSSKQIINAPHIKKFRASITKAELRRVVSREHHSKVDKVESSSQRTRMTGYDCVSEKRPSPNTTLNEERMQPIIWKLNTERHYGSIEYVKTKDIRWGKKIDKAVFRGTMTGFRQDPSQIHKIALSKNDSDARNSYICMENQRCRLVHSLSNSSLVDAKLTNTFSALPNEIDGQRIVAKSRMSIRHQLKYKAILCLEGNDVSTALKWALASLSVVIMPASVFTSWAMEELLEPWVHYVPMVDDDAEAAMQWILDNDEKARIIAIRGALWIFDLLYHPAAAEEEQQIFDEMLIRYTKHFVEEVDGANE